MSESDDDEEYGRSKRRRIIPPKKPSRPRNITLNEPEGMKALRRYTSALKLGYKVWYFIKPSPRCFRGLNKISNVKDREVELISRLHQNGRTWSGEYPSEEDVDVCSSLENRSYWQERRLFRKRQKKRESLLSMMRWEVEQLERQHRRPETL